MKRKHQEIDSEYSYFNVYKSTRSNGQINTDITIPESKKDILWVSATKTYNAMMNNHLVDWLNIYGKELLHEHKSNDEFSNFLMKQGQLFEQKIYTTLSQKFQTKKVSEYYSTDSVKQTVEFMKEGIPIIISASLSNSSTATYGIADMLIRSDYINQVFNDPILSDDLIKISAKKLKQPYHYRVFDIKYSTVYLAANGKFILNKPKFNAYKAQLYIYNQALGKLQGYTPEEAYIVGRKTIYWNNNIKYETSNALDKVGVINFETNDQKIVQMAKESVWWYRIVQRKGAIWKLEPPSVQELYPNMNVDSGKWNNVKKELSIKLGEITLLWNCGIKQRENIFNNNIISFYSEDLSIDMLALGKKTSNIVQNIIMINNQTSNNKLITPSKIHEPSIKTKNNEFYIDFETFTDICQTTESIPKHQNFNMIFMIGIGWYDNNEWNINQYIAKTPDYQGETEIIFELCNFLQKFKNPRLYHWKADELFWNKALERNNLVDSKQIKKFEWFDIMQIF